MYLLTQRKYKYLILPSFIGVIFLGVIVSLQKDELILADPTWNLQFVFKRKRQE